jgi:hypothetical protein
MVNTMLDLNENRAVRQVGRAHETFGDDWRL